MTSLRLNIEQVGPSDADIDDVADGVCSVTHSFPQRTGMADLTGAAGGRVRSNRYRAARSQCRAGIQGPAVASCFDFLHPRVVPASFGGHQNVGFVWPPGSRLVPVNRRDVAQD